MFSDFDRGDADYHHYSLLMHIGSLHASGPTDGCSNGLTSTDVGNSTFHNNGAIRQSVGPTWITTRVPSRQHLSILPRPPRFIPLRQSAGRVSEEVVEILQDRGFHLDPGG